MKKVKVGDEITVKEKNFENFTYGKLYRVNHIYSRHFALTNNSGIEVSFNYDELNRCFKFPESEIIDEAPKHYDNSNGSLYMFADNQGLNTWEFDIVKRIVRCRKKGSFVEDLEKTKFLIDLYLKEWKEKKED